MIIGFSTSSAWSSVAAIDPEKGVLWHGSENAPQGASGACLRLLEGMARESGLQLKDAELFVADLGPGSFTGVRVGVTLAKTFGYLFRRQVAGATSFDLISSKQVVVLPSKKGEFFVRKPGIEPIRQVELPEGPFIGFGPGIENQVFPSAARFYDILGQLVAKSAMEFAPEYLIEPSISIPKKPFVLNSGGNG